MGAISDIPNGDVPKASLSKEVVTLKKSRWKAPTPSNFLANKDNSVQKQVAAYLQRFGYMQSQTLDTAQDLTTALSSFQSFTGLAATGIYDEATAALMSEPRCGVPDKPTGSHNHSANFVAQGSKWNKTALTYRFANFTPDMTPSEARATIAGAFARWAAITPLTFSEATSGEDITISFVRGAHGDNSPFDGPGSIGPDGKFFNVWAHADYPNMPLTGDIHFDEYETWSPFFLSYVALHEIGHSLGLAHSPLFGAVMYFDGGAARTELQPDDMAGIHSIYGS
jgi:hypothetical protein